MSILGLCLLLVLAVVAYRFFAARTPKARQRSALKALLQACHGDQELCERLIFAEMEHSPDIDFTEAARRAKKRLLRDR